MSKKVKPEYQIEAVETLPKSKREKVAAYDSIIKDLEGKEKGFYKVSIPNKKATTIYVGLIKRVKDKRDKFKLHMVNKEVYIEKL
jgi:hypothetical protein